MVKSLICFTALLMVSSAALAASKGMLTIEGSVVDSTNTPVTAAANASMSVYIYAPNNCLLWQENFSGQTITDGGFVLAVGGGANLAAGGLSFANVFQNGITFGSVAQGSGPLTSGCTGGYTGAATDDRSLYVVFNSGGPFSSAQTSPVIPVKANPQDAMLAGIPVMLNGVAPTNNQVLTYNSAGYWYPGVSIGSGANQLVELNSSSQLPAVSGALLTNLSAANLTGTTSVANGGTGAASLTANGVLLGNGTGAVTAIAPGTSTYVLTSNGPGSAPSWQAASGGGTITSVTAGTGLSGGGASGAVTLNMTSVGTAGTYTKVTTNTLGQVSSGTNLNYTDIKSTVAGNWWTAGACAAGSVATYLSASDSVSCQAYSLTTAQVTAALATAGSVGIGTATPNVSLDFSGKTDAIRLPAGTTAQEPTGAGAMAGDIRYNTSNSSVEFYNGATWTTLSAGGGGLATTGGTMTGAIYEASGSAAAPTYSFSASTSTGMAYGGSSNILFDAGGSTMLSIGTTTSQFYNSAVYFQSGTSAAPSIASTGAGTGIFFPSSPTAGSLGISTVGVQRMVFDNAGRAGIGVTSPAATLDVGGPIFISGQNGVSFPSSESTPGSSIAIGPGALAQENSFTSGNYYNTAVGYGTLGSGGLTTAAFDNTALGYKALGGNTTGTQNTGVGTSALGINTTGGYNTAVGVTALGGTTGSFNTAVGDSALMTLTNGSNNTAIGFNVGHTTLSTGSGNILIGTSNAVDTPLSTTSNFLNIGNAIFATGITGTLAAPAGNVGIGTASPGATLDVAGHIANSGSGTPTLTCGTSPSITGNDTRGTVKIGSGPPASCVVSFAAAYTSTPFCVVSGTGTASGIILFVTSVGTSSFTVGSTSSLSGYFTYICMQ